MIVTVYRGARDATPADVADVSWPELCDELSPLANAPSGAPPGADRETQKRALAAWAPHELAEGTTRAAANVVAITALALDVDHGDPDAVIAALEAHGWAALLYASPSDTPDARRFRVVAPIATPIAPAKCRATRLAFAEALGLAPGCGVEGACDPARIFFAGRLHGTAPRDVAVLDGRTVDPIALPAPRLAWGAAQAPAATATPLGALPPANAGIAAALGDWRAHQGHRWHLCGAVGGVMRRMGYSAAQCEAAVRAWLPPPGTPGVDVQAGVTWALGAWQRDAADVSGHVALETLLGAEHAAVIEAAAYAGTPFGRVSAAHTAPAPKWRAVASGDGAVGLARHGRIVDRAHPPPPLEYVIEGLDLAPGKVSAVQAFANVAKTPFALLMAICVAAGKPFLGHATSQRNALFLAFEGGVLTEEREARLCAGLGVRRTDVPLHFMHVDSSIGEALIDDLHDYMCTHAIGLVVVDTYGSALPGDVDHNSDKFSLWLKALGKLSDATGALVVVLLHENKSEGARGLRRMSGHNSAPGAIQASIALERRGDERTVVDVVCSREVRQAFEPFRIRFSDVPNADAPTGTALVVERVTAAPSSALSRRPQVEIARAEKEARTRRAGERIWHHVRASGTNHTRRELSDVGGHRNVAPEAIARLLDAGLVDEQAGTFRATKPTATDAEVSLALSGVRGGAGSVGVFQRG